MDCFRSVPGVLLTCALAVGCGGRPTTRGNPFDPVDAGGGSADVPGRDGTDAPVTTQDVATTGDGARRCMRQADCDDGQACTRDTCVFGGVCEYEANDGMCMAGQRCFPGRGCAAARSCMANGDCADGVECTRDLCVAGGMCENIRDDSRCPGMQVCTSAGCTEQGRCRVDSDCDDRVYCNGVERCVMMVCQRGTPVACMDMDMCTADVCNERTRMCEHPRLDPCGSGTVMPGTYNLAPAPQYRCGAGAFGPVTTVTISVAGGVTVTGFPVALRGAAPSGGMFNATGNESRGGCEWMYSFSGSFTAPGRFAGSWAVSLGGLTCDVSLGCLARSDDTTGTLRM